MAGRRGNSNLGTAHRLGPRQRIKRRAVTFKKEIHQRAQLFIKR